MKKNIVIGVTGGIACYKSLEIVNQLNKDGFNVEVIMTKSAREFIKPLSFHTLSNNPVIVDMYDDKEKYTTTHIDITKRADLIAIIPATANFIGKVANGIADDMLSTVMLSVRCPVVIAPAMNQFMYENTFVQRNIKKLEEVGYNVLGTEKGRLACGDVGTGKLLPWEDIYEVVINYFK